MVVVKFIWEYKEKPLAQWIISTQDIVVIFMILAAKAVEANILRHLYLDMFRELWQFCTAEK